MQVTEGRVQARELNHRLEGSAPPPRVRRGPLGMPLTMCIW